MHHIAAIVLAAGSSRRFGTDKLLHPFGQDAMPLAATGKIDKLRLRAEYGAGAST